MITVENYVKESDIDDNQEQEFILSIAEILSLIFDNALRIILSFSHVGKLTTVCLAS